MECNVWLLKEGNKAALLLYSQSLNMLKNSEENDNFIKFATRGETPLIFPSTFLP